MDWQVMKSWRRLFSFAAAETFGSILRLVVSGNSARKNMQSISSTVILSVEPRAKNYKRKSMRLQVYQCIAHWIGAAGWWSAVSSCFVSCKADCKVQFYVCYHTDAYNSKSRWNDRFFDPWYLSLTVVIVGAVAYAVSHLQVNWAPRYLSNWTMRSDTCVSTLFEPIWSFWHLAIMAWNLL